MSVKLNRPIGSGAPPRLLSFVDHSETYGPHVIKSYIGKLPDIKRAADLGAGAGRDINFVKNHFPQAELYAVECMPQKIMTLEKQGIKVYPVNIEAESLPFDDESLDLIICNQILEHTKELFWILHEISRVLRIGGHLIVGVPNVASLHNRIGLLFGKHPTQAKSCSAHIRCFSKNDFLLFLNECFGDGYELKEFAGSQFYPFPPSISRKLAKLFPAMAFSIFFLLQKRKGYMGSFLEYPLKATLETNFKIS